MTAQVLVKLICDEKENNQKNIFGPISVKPQVNIDAKHLIFIMMIHDIIFPTLLFEENDTKKVRPMFRLLSSL